MVNRNNSLKYGKMVEIYCPESRAKRLQNKKIGEKAQENQKV